MSGVPYSWQTEAWQQLLLRQQQNSLMQSVLITGLPGVGKRAFITTLAHTGLCLNSHETACGHCRACQQMASGSHPDLLQLAPEEDKKEILIDQVRDFCRQIQLTASQSQGRYALIHGADRLNIAAANALLKTLEEPPPSVRILLSAEKLARIPATIRSRCSRIHIPCPNDAQARAWLAEKGVKNQQHWSHRRMGPCGMETGEGSVAKEGGWLKTIQNLQANGDILKAATTIDEADFDAFIGWWQEQLLVQMKQGQLNPRFRRMWDALITVRRQGHQNFNRLLALEGLFILYTNLGRSH